MLRPPPHPIVDRHFAHIGYYTQPGLDWPILTYSRKAPCLGAIIKDPYGHSDDVGCDYNLCNPDRIFDHAAVLNQDGRPAMVVGHPYLPKNTILKILQKHCNSKDVYFDTLPWSPYGYGTNAFFVAKKTMVGIHLLSKVRESLGCFIIHERKLIDQANKAFQERQEARRANRSQA